jgi:hypothetical protein
MPCRSGEPSEYEVHMLKAYQLEKKVRELETSNCLMMDFLLKNDLLKQFEADKADLLYEEFKVHRKEDFHICVNSYHKKLADILIDHAFYSKIIESGESWVVDKILALSFDSGEIKNLLQFLNSLSEEEILGRVYYKNNLLF